MEMLTPGLLFIVSMVLFSAFAKIFTAFSILGVGIGMRGIGFGAIIAGLSLLLSWMVVQPYLGDDSVIRAASQAQNADIVAFEVKMKPFLEKNVQPEVKQSLDGISAKLRANAGVAPEKQASSDIRVLGAAFMISQLKEAFYLGLLFLVPFVVVDLIVTNIMMLLGITQISAAVLALPVKVLLFVAVDGWTLVSERLLNTFIVS